LIEAVQGIYTEKNLNEYKQYFSMYLKPQMQQGQVKINQTTNEVPKIDLNILVQEREKLIQNKLKLRFEELQKILNTNPTQDKLKILISLQSIKLYETQKRLRNDICSEILLSTEQSQKLTKKNLPNKTNKR